MASTSPAPTTSTPRVLAIVVAHDGAPWVTAALRTLDSQRYPALSVMAVDNASTDGTGDVLRRRLGADNVLSLDTNVGFGRGVAAALRTDRASECEYVLLVHDDMALMPDAVQWLVEAMESDQSLSIVGPKLREWDEEALLQQVGLSADTFLRAETQLDPGELDQGQHDARGDVLFVSTAGMLIRRDVFATLGGFDPRFGAFRDDMDLCWRVWLAGRRVGVVPQAVGYHHAAASNGRRAGTDLRESRYLIERNTLASVLKNYSARRLAWVLPLGLLLNVLRALALLVARRFGESFGILQAYVWNAVQLPGTLRRRRLVQATRRQTDGQLASLFASGLPRVTEYSESLLELLAGGSTRALVDADDVARRGVDPLAEQPIQRFLRDRPLVLLGIPLLLAFLASLGGYLGPGPIVGGQISAWPESPTAFLQQYLSPWGGEPLGSASFPSPVQVVLGLASAALGGSAWLAQRVLVFGLLPLAFLTTLRAGRLVTSRPWPRVVGATVYVVSPVVLGTLAEGRYGLAVLAAMLPAVVSLTITTANPDTSPGVAWRSAALLSLAVLLSLGSAPVEGLVAPAIVAVAAVIALTRGWGRPLLRLAVGGAGALVLLAPWLFDVVREGGPAGDRLATSGGAAAIVHLPLWRALLGQPQIVDGIDGVLGVLVVAVPAAILFGALVVGMRARPLITSALVLLFVATGAAAWATAYYRLPLLDPMALLLPGAVALAVLSIIVARWSTETLTSSDFGVSQVATAVAGITLVVGLLGSLTMLAAGPWTALREDPQLLPAFIGADGEDVGPYRVLIVDLDEDGTVLWELTDADGPRMTEFGTIRDGGLTDLIGDTVTRIAAGGGSGAASTLGVLNIRYVVLSRPVDVLQAAMSQQVDLEPLPSNAAVTYRVRTWLPRASVVPEPQASRLLATGDPGPTDGLGAGALLLQSPGVLRGGVDGPDSGVLVVSEASASAWRAATGATELEQLDFDPVNAFTVDAVDGEIRVVIGGGLRRRAVAALQVLVALALLSLAVRPPGGRTAPTRTESLPQDLVGLADATTSFPRIDPDRPPAVEPPPPPPPPGATR